MPRPLAKLNALAVQRATKPGLLSDGGGLYLKISENGTKSWVFRYMLNGRARGMGLGPVALRSLSEARQKALEACRCLLEGKDPIEARGAQISEIPEFMTSLRTRTGIASLALEFLILTAARAGEVRGAMWEEISFEECAWTIPASRMKAKRQHRVPLSPRAMEILEQLRGEHLTGFIFPGHVGGRPLSDVSLTALLRRMKCEVTSHGFRSTFRDWAAERTIYPREVAETALAHVLRDKTEAAYRRGDFFEKRRNLMNSWAEYCSQSSVGSNLRGNVIEMNGHGTVARG